MRKGLIVITEKTWLLPYYRDVKPGIFPTQSERIVAKKRVRLKRYLAKAGIVMDADSSTESLKSVAKFVVQSRRFKGV